jgi:hypothetical protein
MMTPDELATLALSVADGDAVDWERRGDDTGRPAELAALQLVAEIAEGHRMDLELGDRP